MKHEARETIDEYLTVDDICAILMIGRNKGYKLVSQNDFPKVVIGKAIRIPKEQFGQYMKRYLYKNIEL